MVKSPSIEQIVSYLPYQVKMQAGKKKGTLQQLLKDSACESGYMLRVTCENWWQNCNQELPYLPILRPQKQLLTNCIDGQCPLSLIEQEHNRTCPLAKRVTSVLYEFPQGYSSLALFGFTKISKKRVDMPFWAYEWLCKWHFDLYGLIDEGLAIELK